MNTHTICFCEEIRKNINTFWMKKVPYLALQLYSFPFIFVSTVIFYSVHTKFVWWLTSHRIQVSFETMH